MPRNRRTIWIALVVGLAVVSAVGVGIQIRMHDTGSSKSSPSTTPGPSTPIVSTTPPPTAPPIKPFAGATSVAAYGADGKGRTDDTAAFTAAMTAALAGPTRLAKGPSGHPQAVVRVPPGTYRIFHLPFQNNIRMEVDAGAVLEQAGNLPLAESNSNGGPVLIVWDGTPGHALTNVSIIGVGSTSTALKKAAGPIEPGFNIDHDFTFDLNTQRTGGDNYDGAMQLANVDWFLIDNVYSIQNGTPSDPTDPNTGKIGEYPRPTSSRAVLVLRPRNDSKIGGPYYDPHNGAIRNHYNVGGPYGYGPNQITSGHNVRIVGVYSRGGVTLRLETDATLRKNFGGQLSGIVASEIVGVNCNRAVAFAPHAQRNTDVHVSHVVARNCQQGVIESEDESLSPSQRGVFASSSLTDVRVVGGTGAQDPVSGRPGLWSVGKSVRAFARDQSAHWSVRMDQVSCSGAFSHTSETINVDGTMRRPSCA